MTNKGNNLSMYAVGDVLVDYERVGREKPETIFDLVAPLFRQADIAYFQCETIYSEEVTPARSFHGVVPPRNPRNFDAITYAGFNVTSLANNHTMDSGIQALYNTIELCHQNGIPVTGAGRNLSEAKKPAIIERKGTRVAFLAYNCVGPPGYDATEVSPGNVAFRVWTLYQPLDYQPGTPCQVRTYPDIDDLNTLREDVRKARELADIVVVCPHWGLHHVQALLSMYQQEIAHAAIDAGADLILGLHDHVLKGIEVYRGRVIFYGLGNFAIDKPLGKAMDSEFGKLERLLYDMEYDPNYPTYAYPPESQISMIARCIISNKQIQKVSFLPVLINRMGQPQPLPRSNSESERVVRYIRWITESQGLNAIFTRDGDELAITAAAEPASRLGPSLLRFVPAEKKEQEKVK